MPPWALVVNTLETGFVFPGRRSQYEQTAHGSAIHRVEEMDAYVATVFEDRCFQTVRRKTTYVAQSNMIESLYLCRIHGRIMFEKTILGRHDGLMRKLLFTALIVKKDTS